MTIRHIALLTALNALLTLGVAAYVWLAPTGTAFAMLDVAELYRLKERQVAAVLVKRDASDADRAAAIQHAGNFGAELAAVVESLPQECRCLILVRGAVTGSSRQLPDLTPLVRQRLGL